MAMNRRKGQSFILAAVLFTGLFVVAFIPSGPSINRQKGAKFKIYFEQSFNEKLKNFNNEISEEKSLENVKRGIYSYNRFLEENTASKSIDYSSYSLTVFPHEGRYMFINYQNRDAEMLLYINGSWDNQTVSQKQFVEGSFMSGMTDVDLRLNQTGDRYNFTANRPRYAYWVSMDGRDETWQNSFVG
jgi:hypothetical protein